MNFPLPILNDLTLGYAKTTIIIRGRWTGASQRLDAVRGGLSSTGLAGTFGVPQSEWPIRVMWSSTGRAKLY